MSVERIRVPILYFISQWTCLVPVTEWSLFRWDRMQRLSLTQWKRANECYYLIKDTGRAKCRSTVERLVCWCFKEAGWAQRCKICIQTVELALFVSLKLYHSCLSSEESTPRKRPFGAVVPIRALTSDLAGFEKKLMDWLPAKFGNQTAWLQTPAMYCLLAVCLQASHWVSVSFLHKGERY